MSTVFPLLRPLTIPYHASGPGKGVVKNILDQLEAEDVWEYRSMFEAEGGR